MAVNKANNRRCQGRVNDFRRNLNVNKPAAGAKELRKTGFICNRHD